MNKSIPATTLFLDIGGVMLTNGWGHESRRLAAEAFNLNIGEMEDRHHLTFVDFFISSCFVHFRKPDADIFRIALDIAQVPAEHVVYIEDMQMFVDVARDLGIRSIQHKNYLSTSAELSLMGLKVG